MSSDPFASNESVYFLNDLVWEAFPGHVFTIILTFISFFGTTNIVIATWKTKSLHGTCNYLLAINAFSDSLHQCSHFLHGYIIFTGTNHISRISCVYYNTLPLFGLNTGMITVFIIGIDRLLSILSPTAHRKSDKKLYFLAIFSVDLTFNLVIIFTVYDYALRYPNEQTPCSVPDVLGGYSGDVWFYSCIALNLATIVCYSIVGVTLRYKTAAYHSTRKSFKAIVFIMFTIFCGWTINAMFRVVFSNLKIDRRLFFVLSIYFGTFVNIACAANYFILFKFSYDYQIVFKRYLNNIIRTFSRNLLFSQNESSVGQSVAQTRNPTFAAKQSYFKTFFNM